MRKKGFTLIELLVVIAIIGLLASVVLVSMSGLQGKAKITKTLEFSQSLQRNLGAYAVGVWSFDDQTNPTKDGSGYNNNGALMNDPTFTPDTPHLAAGVGTGKYALSFDGVDDYVDAGKNGLEILGDITIEAWVKRTKNTTSKESIIRKGDWAVYEMYISNHRLYFGHYTPSENVSSFGVVSVGAWHHLVVTRRSGNVSLYIDGKLDNTGTTVDDTNPHNENLTMGRGHSAPFSTLFTGLIDEVRIYEKALTLGEIQKRYADSLEGHQDLANR